MNEYLAVLLRHTLTIFGTWLVLKGVSNQETVDQFINSVLPIILGLITYLLAQVLEYFKIGKVNKKLTAYETRIAEINQAEAQQAEARQVEVKQAESLKGS